MPNGKPDPPPKRTLPTKQRTGEAEDHPATKKLRTITPKPWAVEPNASRNVHDSSKETSSSKDLPEDKAGDSSDDESPDSNWSILLPYWPVHARSENLRKKSVVNRMNIDHLFKLLEFDREDAKVGVYILPIRDFAPPPTTAFAISHFFHLYFNISN